MADTLFTNVRILDGTGAEPYSGSVMVQRNRIHRVGRGAAAIAILFGVGIVFASALPANAAGKTLKPPLVDEWGADGDSVHARLQAFITSLPPALLERPHFKLEGTPLTPLEALAALDAGDADDGRRRRLQTVIAGGGLVALLRPDEARFRGA